MSKGWVLFGLIGLLAGHPASAAEAVSDRCPPRWGRAAAPLVPDAETAKAIFVAVERRFNPNADRKSFPDVVAEDAGDGWNIFRIGRPKRSGLGGGGTIKGGGQLEMKIAKCDAAISDVYFAK